MGLSIIWVMFFHSSYAVGTYPIISKIKGYGNMGVDFFLLLSAIGLFYSMTKKGSVLAFYKKRAWRILPATIICLTPWIIYLSYTGRNISVTRFTLDITSLGF
jgi:peptidoglycan/LPS O-acetylase OafA/YrhL